MKDSTKWLLLIEEIEENQRLSLVSERDYYAADREADMAFNCAHDDVGLEPVDGNNPTSPERTVCRSCGWTIGTGEPK